MPDVVTWRFPENKIPRTDVGKISAITDKKKLGIFPNRNRFYIRHRGVIKFRSETKPSNP